MSRPATSALRQMPCASSSSRIFPSASSSMARRPIMTQEAPRPTRAPMQGRTLSVNPLVLEGMGQFLPKENMDNLCEWQTGLWKRLQSEVGNNPGLLEVKQKWDNSGLDMTYLLSQTAKEQSMTLAFNWGSLLLNNSFFLENINANADQDIPDQYKALEDKVAAYADGIVGSAWLWLVRSGDNHSDFDVVPTFGSGTFLVANRAQRGRQNIPVFGTPYSSESTAEETRTRTFSPFDQPVGTSTAPSFQARLNEIASGSSRGASKVAQWPAPLAVLNLHELAYLGPKYGIWDRGRYARDWFRCLDWRNVQQRSSQLY